MGETPSGATVEVYEAQSSSVSMASRSVSCTLSLPVQYRATHVPGWPEEFKSEESVKSGTEKDTNRANSTIKHPTTWLTASLYWSHDLYEDWPLTFLDEGSC